jgi:hypothetical protein
MEWTILHLSGCQRLYRTSLPKDRNMSAEAILISAAIVGFMIFWYLCRTAPAMIEDTPDDRAPQNGVAEQLDHCSDREAESADSSLDDPRGDRGRAKLRESM